MDEYIFGANILENLTTGMYKDSKVSYREYIQNACDQIDKAVKIGLLDSTKKGKIEIWLDAKKRTISIEDNATGIPSAEFESTLANIANSQKQIGEDKGFRGIGRLCGLAYCRELVFTSTAFGESVISEMRCDAQKMREMLNRNVNGEKFTASEVLREIFSFNYTQSSKAKEEHWFKVELIDVNDENEDLLDFQQVKDYLSFVAPVPFHNKFIYRSEIYKHADKLAYSIDEYRIKLNGEDVFKNYGTKFKTSKGDDEIFAVEFKDFYDNNGNLIMWLWFGISRFKATISKESAMRGIRLRKENIQIGNEDALQKLFKEDRGQHYFIGEVYGVSKELVPNSQRDYFNENEMRLWFERELRKYFKESLTKVYYDGSKVNSAFKKIDDHEKSVDEHNRKVEQNEFNDSNHRTKSEESLQQSEDKASEAQKTIEKLKQSTDNDDASKIIKRVVEKLENERKKEQQPTAAGINKIPFVQPTETVKPKKPQNRTDKLSRCSKQERKLIGKIYNIIIESTDEKTAETIIKNIEDEFK